MIEYLNGKELFVRDAYACAHEKYKLNLRVINEFSWSNLFAYNMFLRPSDEEIINLKQIGQLLMLQDLKQIQKKMEQDNITLPYSTFQKNSTYWRNRLHW